MRMLPITELAQVLRTDFSDEPAWNAIKKAIQTPEPKYGFVAYVAYVDDRAYEGIDIAQLLELVPARYNHSYIFVADQKAMSLPEHPLQVVDLYEQPGRSFRVILPEVWAVENNLSIANMDFEDFSNAIDPDGVHRGFPEV